MTVTYLLMIIAMFNIYIKCSDVSQQPCEINTTMISTLHMSKLRPEHSTRSPKVIQLPKSELGTEDSLLQNTCASPPGLQPANTSVTLRQRNYYIMACMSIQPYPDHSAWRYRLVTSSHLQKLFSVKHTFYLDTAGLH